ncbi:MAG: polysaccharide biosynthesis tyrosine autokinase [Bacteroidaceae bacterium]|nr:polysaccharide biosynthesis tyrosine autokinase [Bacteroidaceae bacterium]
MAEDILKKEMLDEETINWEEYLHLFLRKWYWFAASVLIALCVAVFHIMRTTPTYTRSTSLLIKDEENSKMNAAAQSFQDLGIIGVQKNINNEMLIISAPIMMHEVASRLQLDIELTTPESLHEHPLYNDAPITVKFTNRVPEESFMNFVITLKDNNSVLLSNFNVMGEKHNSRSITAQLGQEVKTPAGLIKIEATPMFKEWPAGTEITLRKYPLSSVGKMYAGRLSVGLSDKDATIIQLTLTDEVTQRAEDVLLTLIDVYNEQWVKDKNRIAESTFQFISDRLDTISKELGNVDMDISEFKSRNLIPDVQAASARYLSESSKMQDNLLNLNNQLNMAKYIRNYLNDGNRQNQLLPANTGISNSGIEAQIQNYNEMLMRRDDLLANSSMQNSLVKDLTDRLAAQKMAITRSIDNLIVQLSGQIANVQLKENSTTAQIASNPQHERLLKSMSRQQNVKEALYIFLLQKREENELSKAYTAYNTRIIQPPTGSNAPAAPRRSMIMLIAFAIGLIVPAALIFIRDAINHTVRGRSDLEKYDTPLVGEIPLYAPENRRFWQKKQKSVNRAVLVEENNSNLMNESFRLLRTKLDYYLAGKNNARVFMLTSFNPGSGKTFITANLAAVMGLNGKRILAIDFDIRKTTLSDMVGKTKNGVSAFLSGMEDDLASIIRKDALAKNVDVLPVGIIPPNPTELLQSEKMQEIFDYARANYDYVLVDCPPIELVADASIIKKYVDACFFVVRVGVMDRRLLKEVNELYREEKYANMAILLNGSTYMRGKYGSYRYGYGYGYGYEPA